MRIHRIRLRNYRGIKDRTVEPDPVGVTVVEGPNEIGKSSIAEALDLILDNLDSSRKGAVRTVQPVDRDVGPEVEVELELGIYRLVYWKRFLKKPETALKVTAPAAEDLTGREAHERVREIISETLDVDLYKAVRVIQDAGIEQVRLEHASSLAQALDRAAGGDVAGERETTIFDAVRAEYGIYFTETGSPRKPLSEVDSAVEKASATVAGLERELGTVERLIEDSRRLDRDVEALAHQQIEAKQTAALREAEVAEIQKQEEQVYRLRSARDQTAHEEARLTRDHQARQDLICAAQEAADEADRLRQASAESAPALGDASGGLERARQVLRSAEQEAEASAFAAKLAAADVEYHGDRLNLDLLKERRDRIQTQQAERDEANEFLQECKVDEQLVKRLRSADRELIRVQAQLSAGSPKLRVTALRSIALEMETETRHLQPGASFEETVGEKRGLRIPSVAEVEVSAGTSLETLVVERDKAQQKLVGLLRRGAVSNIEEAEQVGLKRRDAQGRVDAANKSIQTDLRDLSFEQMLCKISRLGTKVDAYPARRVTEPELPESLDAAKARKVEAEVAREGADQALRMARARYEAADVHWRELQKQAADIDRQLDIQIQLQLKDQSALERAREHRTDAALERDLQSAQQAAAAAYRVWESADRQLASKDPERARELARNARQAADRAVNDLRNRENERNKALAKLEVLGGQGLYEELEQARTHLEHAARQQRTVHDRAAAARLLYETMRRKRDEAREAYAAPLRAKIVQLGRFVFDDSFDVELDDKLAIEKRSLGGVTLPFTSISVGAREQLGLIVRVACSLLVAEHEGVPLLFDDTLGHTDPSRLEGMGAMLSQAGRLCQVIIFTCTPGRFRHIGDARTIDLGSAHRGRQSA